ncbi:hypothetical protein SESBI_28536 [Sesbania bispinosa]|nr:hypothetical protein SESBI_28536 [Sesbania bispinosa]
MYEKPFKKLHLLYFFLVFHVTVGTSTAQNNDTNYCGDIKTETSFLNPNSSITSLLSNITLCRSQNLYLRTSLGLFQVSSVDYNARILTISHSCSSSQRYISPLDVTTGFPSPPEPNSLLLFNCTSRRDSIPSFIRNCRGFHKCGDASSMSSRSQEQEKRPYSCLVIEDLQKVEKGFHPEDLNCSHYSWGHRSSSDGEAEEYRLGTWMSFDIIPDHVQDLCKECERPNGNCGVGLKCLCHAKECKDKLISESGSIKSIGNTFLSFLSFIGAVAFFMDV